MLVNHSFGRPEFLAHDQNQAQWHSVHPILFFFFNLRHLPQFSTIPQSTLRRQKRSVLPDEACQLPPSPSFLSYHEGAGP